jgi:hypothetical protein
MEFVMQLPLIICAFGSKKERDHCGSDVCFNSDVTSPTTQFFMNIICPVANSI